MIDSDELVRRCDADGELQLAVRHWSGGLRLLDGDRVIGFTVDDGRIDSGPPPEDGPGVITLTAPSEVWAQMAAEVPTSSWIEERTGATTGSTSRRRARASRCSANTPPGPTAPSGDPG